ncbi:hypothetical protein EKO23_22535 [Nocardioides guangzhouensis]|uniref:Integral membrane protein n=1 Tax=Nocardioides guangzhouensis TaxID=2497878 RepID=A0A4Q4Z500_9ACTN|nr:hypothetical protein [Nocardioides guangzhouensis]RYP82081.1 hypothetical protein EKO23_22535 [Nocardioides guangzhouensis]
MNAPSAEVAAAERWFVAHGLPYFVDDVRAHVHAGLRRSRLAAVLLTGLLVGAAVGAVVGVLAGDVSIALTVGSQVLIAVLVLYALTTLRAGAIARWALRRTFGSLGLLFPLVTRALPLLLLFVTFLFINTEVWQVSAELDGSVMWLTVLLFSTVAIGFLLVRLPEEMEVFDKDLDPERVVAGVRGTPLEDAATTYADRGDTEVDTRLGGLQKANLVLVLLIAQAVQVLLLSVSVFGFFVVFGVLAMDPTVIESWLGHPPQAVLGGSARLSRELVQVSVFLAAFSGLYFTVYAVTDELYRKQFFTTIVRELERAVSARAAYRMLKRAG